MSSTNNWKPLLYSLGFIFIVGLIVTGIGNSFPLPPQTNDPILNTSIDIVNNGIGLNVTIPLVNLFTLGLWDGNINPHIDFFGFLGDNVKQIIVNDLIAFNQIPFIVAMPIIILLIVAMFYPIAYILIDLIGALR